MSKLSCAIYISKENISFSNESIIDLVDIARKANQIHQITGFIYYRQQYFLQYIEGHPDEVKQLLKQLEEDSRHTIINYFIDDQLEQRRFVEWRMGRLDNDKLIQIKFEDVILDYLYWIKKYTKANHSANDFKNTWSMVDKLASFRNKGITIDS